jgi:hypothetical protein
LTASTRCVIMKQVERSFLARDAFDHDSNIFDRIDIIYYITDGSLTIQATPLSK